MPENVTVDEIYRIVQRIDTKVDRIGDKVTETNGRVGRHAIRLDRTEQAIRDLKERHQPDPSKSAEPAGSVVLSFRPDVKTAVAFLGAAISLFGAGLVAVSKLVPLLKL